MTAQAWFSLVVTVAVFVALQFRRWPADLLFLIGLVATVAVGIFDPQRGLTPEEALAGFANPAVITIGALFVVAAGMRSTGALDLVGEHVLGRARHANSAMRRLCAPVVALSAFMNNTPIVAMIVPVVVDWCRRHNVSPSRLLIPISYLAIIGGTCTLIGTSTNLVVNGMLARDYARPAGELNLPANLHEELRPMHMFEITKVGLPCTVVGALYLLLFGHRLLPNRTELIEKLGDERREYLVEMFVQPECRLIGKTVERAGLRHLPGLFLIEIDRAGEIIAPITPEDVIHEGDRLIFTGVVTTIADLERIPGLVPAADMTYEVKPSTRQRRHLTEAVLSNSSPLIGKTVRDAKFRRIYNAAIVAVHRNGQRLGTKIGDIRLEAGDTLLLQTRTDFEDSHRHSRDFSLVASLEGTRARRHDRAWLAFLLLAVLVGTLTLVMLWNVGQWAPVVALGVAGLMVASRCIRPADARGAIDLQVLLTIGAALGLGLALTKSGAAAYLAGKLVGLVANNPYVALTAVYLLTLVFTEMITNTAVAALMFPLAVAVASASADGWSPRPFVMAIAIAASSSFITPIGYQTNLMVMGPGGYQPSDYLKAGLPLAGLVMITSLVLIPIFWPF